ncbi:hypothetical protein SMICM17S_03265 [Streptomyces microflavus]
MGHTRIHHGDELVEIRIQARDDDASARELGTLQKPRQHVQ